MARRREAPAAHIDRADVIPRDLVEHLPYNSEAQAVAVREQRRRRDRWLTEHGVEPSSAEAAGFVAAAQKVHGIPQRRLRIEG